MYSSNGGGHQGGHNHSHGSSLLFGRNGLLGSFWVRCAFACAFALLLLVTYRKNVESNRLLRISDETLNECNQKHDSVSAQLQVVYEHKSRLETSLELEKKNSKTAKELSLQKLDTAQKALNDEKNKYGELSQQFDHLQRQLNEMKAERLDNEKKETNNIEQLNNQITRLRDDLSATTNDKTNALQELEQLRDQMRTINRELSECRETMAAKQPSKVDTDNQLPEAEHTRKIRARPPIPSPTSDKEQSKKTADEGEAAEENPDVKIPPYRAAPPAETQRNSGKTPTPKALPNLAEILERGAQERQKVEEPNIDDAVHQLMPPAPNDNRTNDIHQEHDLLPPQQRVVRDSEKNAPQLGENQQAPAEADVEEEKTFDNYRLGGDSDKDSVVFDRKPEKYDGNEQAKPPVVLDNNDRVDDLDGGIDENPPQAKENDEDDNEREV